MSQVWKIEAQGLVKWYRILVVTSREWDDIGSASCRTTRICDELCIGLLLCSSEVLHQIEKKKEELFYSASPLFIDMSLLVFVTATPLACLDVFTSCVVRCFI